MQHVSVMTTDILEHAHITPRSRVIDGTLGSGGHSREVAKLLGKYGTLIAIDRDSQSIARVAEKGIPSRGTVHIVHGNFADSREIMTSCGLDAVDTIILDLGWSMDQFADSARGFSFMVDGPLDMRLDYPSDGPSAADIVNSYSESDLADLFYNLADETKSRIIAKAITSARKKKKITTTFELVDIISSVSGRSGKTHPATKVFQALRIEVNHELSDLVRGIPDAIQLLAPKGRLLVLTFHSIEDRIVKHTMNDLGREGIVRVITKKPIPPSAAELRQNSRSRSALLRIVEKI